MFFAIQFYFFRCDFTIWSGEVSGLYNIPNTFPLRIAGEILKYSSFTKEIVPFFRKLHDDPVYNLIEGLLAQ